MKKIVLLAVCASVSAFTWAGPGDDGPRSLSGAAVIKSESSFKVIYKSESVSDVYVSIFDAAGEIVFAEKIRNSDGFMRPYNFKDLKEGDYTIQIKSNSGTQEQKVHHCFSRHEKLAQLVNLGSGKYMLTVPGKSADQLSIRIYDENGKLIHAEKESVDGNFGRVYDMSKLVGGAFSVEVTDNQGQRKTLKG